MPEPKHATADRKQAKEEGLWDERTGKNSVPHNSNTEKKSFPTVVQLRKASLQTHVESFLVPARSHSLSKGCRGHWEWENPQLEGKEAIGSVQGTKQEG